LRFARVLEDELIDLAMYCGLSILIGAGVLYLGRSMWWVYVQTPIGQRYITLFSANAAAIGRFYDQDLLRLAAETNWFVFKAALLVGMLSQSLFLTGRLYENEGGLFRFLFWLMPFTAFCVWFFRGPSGLREASSFIPFFLSSAFLLHSCMRITSRILPEGLILTALWRFITESRCLFMRCH
jgi:hypothetical protein